MNSRFHALPWPDVLAFYDGLVYQQALPMEPMLAFVRYVASSPYAKSLFPCTSHDLLRIGKSKDFMPGDNEIQIRFDAQTQRFLFTHTQRPDEPAPWSRECEASEWRAVFERLLQKRLRWFHEG